MRDRAGGSVLSAGEGGWGWRRGRGERAEVSVESIPPRRRSSASDAVGSASSGLWSSGRVSSTTQRSWKFVRRRQRTSSPFRASSTRSSPSIRSENDSVSQAVGRKREGDRGRTQVSGRIPQHLDGKRPQETFRRCRQLPRICRDPRSDALVRVGVQKSLINQLVLLVRDEVRVVVFRLV